MALADLKVGIVGGSIAGCAAAHAFLKAGCDVQVFERSGAGLEERGSGIAIPIPLRDTLIEKGYLLKDYANLPMTSRFWQFADGTPCGNRLWTQPTPATTNNWGMLWAALRANVPDAIYHEGDQLVDFEDGTDGVHARFLDGENRQFDLLVAADGYRSLCRSMLHPGSEPDFAGYILWRGNYAEEELTDRTVIEEIDKTNSWLTVPFNGGHGVLYMIPDTVPGKRRVNWAIYAGVPTALKLEGVSSIPPGGVTDEVFADLKALLANSFPPQIAALIEHSRQEDVSIQPIFDHIVDTYRGQRTLLVGDAGSMTRPHTASGATKALEDVLAIEELLASVDSVEAFLAGYDQRRCQSAKTLSEIGRNIGDAQVVNTPDWPNMTPRDFEDWIAATLAGRKLYLYGDK